MDTKRGYPYIDYFRVIAAVLVITIHMHPLEDINWTLDIFISHALARLAVPFFLTATGFFFFQGNISLHRLYRTILSILQLYGIAILCYLPLNIYRGYFSNNTVRMLLHDFCFSGNMYHLWYLPASIMALSICYLLVKHFSIQGGLVICTLLYIIGLYGDSYYPQVVHIPFLGDLYEFIFMCFGTTRNGVFLAPIFIYIGYLITKRGQMKYNRVLFGVSLLLLMAESFYIHLRPILKTDNMYVFLPFVIYFFVSWLLQYRGSRNEMMQQTSVYMYILHPLFIRLLHIGLRKHSWYFQDWLQFIWIVLLLLLISQGLYRFFHISKHIKSVTNHNH